MQESKELILISVNGPDRPGITSRLMKVLTQDQAVLKDIGQAITHGLLSLSFVVELPQGHEESSLLKDLLFEAKKLELTMNFQILPHDRPKESSNQPEQFILSCVGTQNLSTALLKDLSSFFAQQSVNILRIDKTSSHELTALEITTSCASNLDWTMMKQSLFALSNTHAVDMAFLKNDHFRTSKRLIVFDMDSTLIQGEVINEMARAHGVLDEVEKITAQAMNGELDFEQSLHQRVALLQGFPIEQLAEVHKTLSLTPGASDFIKTVQSLGFKTAVISGGFTYFTEALKKKLELDYAFANQLEEEQGILTGKVKPPLVDGEHKALLLEVLAQQEKIALEQVVAIGDGANDLPMLSRAGLGIAFHAKDVVKKQADTHLGHGPMTSILHFLGIRQ